MAKLGFVKAIQIYRVLDDGTRITDTGELFDVSDVYYDSYHVDVNIQKSITSNSDTASVVIHNHPMLEQMYADKRNFFTSLNENSYEVDILLAYLCEENPNDEESFPRCIFTGDLDDVVVNGDSSITDQSVGLNLTSGRHSSIRTVINKKYPAGTTYLAVVQDAFSKFLGFDAPLISDPLGKLNKTLLRPRTVHIKASELLNNIARDLEMTWGFDAAKWINTTTASGENALKACYFVDKESVFDPLGYYGAGPHYCDGSTGKIGRIGYTKSQFSFTHSVDTVLNIGVEVHASDFGTMNFPDDIQNAFKGRVNRMSISDDVCTLDATYIGDNGRAIIEHDKKNAGAWVL